MNYYEVVCLIKTSVNFEKLTYRSESFYKIGSIVRVPYGKNRSLAIVIGSISKPPFPTKEIIELIEDVIVPNELLELARWVCGYYALDNSTAFSLLLSAGAGKKHRKEVVNLSEKASLAPNSPQPSLTPQQKKALHSIRNSRQQTILLLGVTGSGKTRIYFDLINEQLSDGKSAILLIPEIALSAQLINQAKKIFKAPLYHVHSDMLERQAHVSWQKIAQAKGPVVVIGPRSALFSPVNKLGLIIIDEAHDDSYKQDTNPYYNTLFVAAKRAELNACQLILGTATANVTERYLSEIQRIKLVKISEKINKQTQHQKIVVPLTEKKYFVTSPYVSEPLLQSMKQSLQNKKQTLLYLNRRGFATNIGCSNCDWRAVCDNCESYTTLHKHPYILICHICGRESKPILTCPQCQQPTIRYQGIGTQKLQEHIQHLFPRTNVVRLDRDSSSTTNHSELLKQMSDSTIDILIGTQMITKGFDFQNLETVGVINADTMLYIPDYRAAEKTYQTITQVIGRNDRTGGGGKTFIQTSNPNHPVIQSALNENYEEFYRYEIGQRRSYGYPPFKYLLKITARRKNNTAAANYLQQIAKGLADQFKNITIIGPAPAFHKAAGNQVAWNIICKASKRKALVDVAVALRTKNVITNLDPLNLL